MVLAIAALLLQAPALTQNVAVTSRAAIVEHAATESNAPEKSSLPAHRFPGVKLTEVIPSASTVKAARPAAAGQPLAADSAGSILRTNFSETSSDAASAALSGTYVPVTADAPSGFIGGPGEVRKSNRAWLALAVAGHSAATFDAWSTRHALTRGGMREADPLMRPFAHSPAIYAAIQVAPTIFDYVGRRMSRSQHSWARKIWWVPQAAMTAGFLFSGAHNLANSR
jgi:hypothetical protein